jgi:hypothetical protein
MKQWHEKEKILENQLQDLTRLYGFSSNFKLIKDAFNSFSVLVNDALGKILDSNKLQLAELISLLSSCRGNKITISSIVSHPKKGELKSQVKKVELSSKLDLHYLSLWANTVLERAQDGLYQYEFNWDFKEYIKHYDIYHNEIEHDDFYLEPYTDEELAKALEYERNQKKKSKNYTRNAEYGSCLSFYYNLLLEKGVFSAIKEKEKSGTASGITKEYCFMYDCMVLLRATEQLDDNKEKYTKIKDWIKAFERQNNK